MCDDESSLFSLTRTNIRILDVPAFSTKMKELSEKASFAIAFQ